jgi:hypothetical protein
MSMAVHIWIKLILMNFEIAFIFLYSAIAGKEGKRIVAVYKKN